MRYAIKAHPTIYGGVTFRSRLEARWAAWFDLAGWVWEYEPIDLDGWSPDFRIEFPCGHSECPPSHTLLAEVKPYFDLREFDGHPCTQYSYGAKFVGEDSGKDVGDPGNLVIIPADASAAFGANPSVTRWVMVHGHGCGEYCVNAIVPSFRADQMWKAAGALTQYRRAG